MRSCHLRIAFSATRVSPSVRLARVSLFAGLAALQLGVTVASAAAVDSGPLSIAVPFSIDGVYMNVVNGATGSSPAAVPGWDTNPYFQGTAQPATANFAVFTSATGDPQRATVGSGAGGVTVLTPGTIVNASSTFTTGQLAGAPFVSIGTRYYGMRFTNETTGAVNYGYVLISTSTGLPSPVTRIIRTGYCDAGEAITVPAVPGAPICGASAQPTFVYALLSNAISGNSIYGFSVTEANGALTPIPGVSPLATGGLGEAYFRELLTYDPAKRRLYAANRGSATVSAYSVHPDTGVLTALPFSPINPQIAAIGSIAVHPSGSPLVVGDSAATGHKVASINIADSTASAAVGSPFFQLAASFSSAFSRDGNCYYTGGNNSSGTSGFAVNPSTGVLTSLPGSPFSLGPVHLAYATDAAGRIFSINSSAIVNGVLSPVAAFTTTSGVPAAVSGSYLPSGLSVAVQGRLSPNDNQYAAVGQDSNTVGVYRITGSGSATTITLATGSPFASGGIKACGLTYNATGTLLFVANCESRNITRFVVDTVSGALSSPTTQAVNSIGTAGEIVGIAYAYSDRVFASGFE